MGRHAQDITKIATRLIVDYGDEAETEAVERAELLHAIGIHEEADLWMAITAHVADLRHLSKARGRGRSSPLHSPPFGQVNPSRAAQ